MPNELAGRIVAHYRRHGVAWDADRRAAAWNDKVWHDRFIDLLPAGAHVLDLGCGGGDPVALNLVQSGFKVTGVDTSPELLALARERMPDQEWIEADIRTLKLGRTFTGVMAWDSYFHLDYDDQRGMFAVFKAHAAPGTVLMFNAGPGHGEGIGDYRGDPLYHASLDPAEYTALLTQHGFAVIEHCVEDRRAGGRTVWVARKN